MNKKLLSILTICIVITCTVAFSACGSNTEPPEFYGKTFELKKLTVDYNAAIDDTTLNAILEENLAYIDWKNTIRANDSTIDYATFEEEVTTVARAKEIIDTFGKDLFGATITFDTKEAKTATMTVGNATEQIVVDDGDSQGANAALKSADGEEFARVSLNYNEDTNEILYLNYRPTVARDFTMYLTQARPLLGMEDRTEFCFVTELNFTLKA